MSELRQIDSGDKGGELKMEMMIGCMKYLKLKIYPMSALDESADFLQALNEIFQNSHSLKIKVICTQ